VCTDGRNTSTTTKFGASYRVRPRRIFPEDKELQAFRKALSDAGYTEGRDLMIEWRVAGGDYAKIRRLVDDLVQAKVEPIVVESTPAARAAKLATTTIPIVMSLVGDPLRSGLVSSFPTRALILPGSPS